MATILTFHFPSVRACRGELISGRARREQARTSAETFSTLMTWVNSRRIAAARKKAVGSSRLSCAALRCFHVRRFARATVGRHCGALGNNVRPAGEGARTCSPLGASEPPVNQMQVIQASHQSSAIMIIIIVMIIVIIVIIVRR